MGCESVQVSSIQWTCARHWLRADCGKRLLVECAQIPLSPKGKAQWVSDVPGPATTICERVSTFPATRLLSITSPSRSNANSILNLDSSFPTHPLLWLLSAMSASSPLPVASPSIGRRASPVATDFAFLVHSPETVANRQPPDVDNKPLARQKRRRTSYVFCSFASSSRLHCRSC
jgi:hypothetical protein